LLGGLKLGETGAGLAAKMATSSTGITAGKLATGLGLAGSLLGFTQQWIDAIAGGGAAIQQGVENARREGERLGNLSGYAAGLLGMDADWVSEYGPIHAVHDGTPSQNRAEDTRIEAYQEAKREGYEAAQRLSDDEALAIVNEVLRYAQERGIHMFETRDPWEGLTNLTERVLPLMAKEMEAGTWQFRELPEPQSQGDAASSEPAETTQTAEQTRADTSGATAATPGQITATKVVLGQGDTLQMVAADALENAWHREPTAAEVAVYMTAIVAANLGALAAPPEPGFSGPVLVLPPVPADPAAAEAVAPAETDTADGGAAEPTEAAPAPTPTPEPTSAAEPTDMAIAPPTLPTDTEDAMDAPVAPTTEAEDDGEPTDAAVAPTAEPADAPDPTDTAPAPADAADTGSPSSVLPDNADVSTGAVDAAPSASPLPDDADVSTGAVDTGLMAASPLPDNADVATGTVGTDSGAGSAPPDDADVSTGDAAAGLRDDTTAALPDGSDPTTGALPAEPVAPPQDVDVQPVQDVEDGP
jgi:hypothetical protein